MNDQPSGRGPRLTAEIQRRLEQELAELSSRRHELVEAIGENDAVEDYGDQAQRLERVDDLGRVTDRIREITEVLAGRTERPAANALPDGTEVTVRFGDGTTTTMLVVAIPEEAPDPTQAVTRDSPLGRALVGARAGNRITYRGPDGEIAAEVVAIRLP
ncbi:GreA/GreB family elongation factor [Pseudonocardia alaniniphila]|uniref:GreA/GreB family elongation factor n=1 Tax=Pseudonocardia alaniniphila TaxID=75291 RepID=A0ABS9TQY6_9PSEU|nr:GreA/GreB family elongation factor [Pseudonocardia alaniniphila]MCH6170960.1 GreA/GreB family elongation factor [Pseudonocardia alaniniphila]